MSWHISAPLHRILHQAAGREKAGRSMWLYIVVLLVLCFRSVIISVRSGLPDVI